MLIKNWQLQRINNTANRINNPSRQQPQKCLHRKRPQQRPEHCHAYPSHCNINHRRKPLRTGNPYGFNYHSGSRNPPYNRQQRVTLPASQYNQTDRRIRTRNQHKDHHMINFAKHLQYLIRYIYGMVHRTCPIQQDHTAHKDPHRHTALNA